MYDVFNPTTGRTVRRTRYRVLARFLAWKWRMDWTTEGSGWLS